MQVQSGPRKLARSEVHGRVKEPVCAGPGPGKSRVGSMHGGNMRAAVLLQALALLVLVGRAAGALLWRKAARPLEGELRNRRLESVPKAFVEIDTALVARTFRQARGPADGDDGAGRAEAPVQVSFAHGEEAGNVTCHVQHSRMLPEAVGRRLPGLFAFSGACDDGSTAYINGQLDHPDGLSATFVTADHDFVYMDSAQAGSNKYVVYRFSAGKGAADGHSAEDFSCGTDDHAEPVGQDEHGVTEEGGLIGGRHALPETGPAAHPRLRGLQSTSKGYVFRLALVANKEYSEFHGGTLDSTVQSLVTLMTRVNGIFKRELGVFFELIEDVDKLICLPSATDAACLELPNDRTLLTRNEGFIRAKGVADSDFDIGHSLSTASGGRASKPSLCDRNKAEGTTGKSFPDTDAFFVDYVTHEMGHQLDASHSFRDCAAQALSNFMVQGAVEPGSGSSVMGYAGICGETNLQVNSDPYFNSVNLLEMRALVNKRVAAGDCGRVVETDFVMPQVSAPEQCTVPASSSFQLQGAGGDAEMWYSWERSDAGYQPFLDSNVARFRSWKPRASRARFFPSMHSLTFGVQDKQRAEVLPTSSESMQFRFTGRKTFDSRARSARLVMADLGDFSMATTELYFDGSIEPLRVVPIEVVEEETMVTFSWQPGGTAWLAPKVQVHVAINTLRETEEFDYEVHEKDLAWELLGEVDNSGLATLYVPRLFEEGMDLDVDRLTVNVMVRSLDDGCFFFDMMPRVPLRVVKDGDESEGLFGSAGPVIGVLVACGAAAGAVGLAVLRRRLSADASSGDDLTSGTAGDGRRKPRGSIAPTNDGDDDDGGGGGADRKEQGDQPQESHRKASKASKASRPSGRGSAYSAGGVLSDVPELAVAGGMDPPPRKKSLVERAFGRRGPEPVGIAGTNPRFQGGTKHRARVGTCDDSDEVHEDNVVVKDEPEAPKAPDFTNFARRVSWVKRQTSFKAEPSPAAEQAVTGEQRPKFDSLSLAAARRKKDAIRDDASESSSDFTYDSGDRTSLSSCVSAQASVQGRFTSFIHGLGGTAEPPRRARPTSRASLPSGTLSPLHDCASGECGGSCKATSTREGSSSL